MSQLSRFGAGALLVALCGCQSVPEHDKFYRYDHDREPASWKLYNYGRDVGLDFLDIFTIAGSVGKSGPSAWYNGNYGFPASAIWGFPAAGWISLIPAQLGIHATKYCEMGWGTFSGYKAGWLGRSFGSWREESSIAGMSFGPLLVMNYSVDKCRIPYCGTCYMADNYLDVHGYNIDLDQNRHWADLALNLNVIGAGFEVGVSPFEALDFAFGLLGNYPNFMDYGPGDMPWDIGVDIADDDTRISVYNDRIDRYRHNPYSIWPTIWPTEFGKHVEHEGDEWPLPYRGPETGSFGGAYGDLCD